MTETITTAQRKYIESLAWKLDINYDTDITRADDVAVGRHIYAAAYQRQTAGMAFEADTLGVPLPTEFPTGREYRTALAAFGEAYGIALQARREATIAAGRDAIANLDSLTKADASALIDALKAL